jgi:hypothetical protein
MICEPTGSAMAGTSCTTGTCMLGLGCHFDASGNGTCYRFCRLAVPTDYGGRPCTQITADYGICF